jgi:hypothetical protein
MSTRVKTGFDAKDFKLETASSNVSKIILSARYPDKGYILNTKSEMVVYVLDGTTVLAREQRKTLHQGSVVLIKKGEKYFWQPRGSTTLLIFSTPPWTPGQQRLHLEGK